VNYEWERLADSVFRCRLPFCDVTIGLVDGRDGLLLVDTGTTLSEAQRIDADARALTGGDITHVLLTHHHFDHILGVSVFDNAAVYAAPAVAASMARHADLIRADAVKYGADPAAVDRAIAAWRPPDHEITDADLELGDLSVAVRHPGRGHTDHDLVATIVTCERTVVFCGDLVEESGDPAVDADSHPAEWPDTLDRLLEIGGEHAAYVPGHGAVVDAEFVRRQRRWLADRGCPSGPRLRPWPRRTGQLTGRRPQPVQHHP